MYPDALGYSHTFKVVVCSEPDILVCMELDTWRRNNIFYIYKKNDMFFFKWRYALCSTEKCIHVPVLTFRPFTPTRELGLEYLKHTRKCTRAECHARNSFFCASVEHICHGNTHESTKTRGMRLVHFFDIFCVCILRPVRRLCMGDHYLVGGAACSASYIYAALILYSEISSNFGWARNLAWNLQYSST